MNLVNSIYLIIVALALVYLLPKAAKKPLQYVFVYIAFSPLLNTLYFVKIGPLSMIEIVVGGYIVFGLLILYVHRRRGIRFGRLGGLFLFFIFSIFMGYLMSEDGLFMTAFEAMLKVLLGLVGYLIFLNFSDSIFSTEKLFQKSVIIGLTTVVALIIIENITGQGVNYSKFSYQVGFFADEGSLSRFGIIGLIFTLPIIFSKTKSPPIYLVIFFSSMYMLFVAISRNAILAALLAGVHMMTKEKIYTQVGIIILIVGMLFMINAVNLTEGFMEKIGKEIRYLEGADVNYKTLGRGRTGAI